MIKVKLSLEKKKVLQGLRNTRSMLGERANYVLLSDAGFSVPEISEKLGRHEHTIRSWLKAYDSKGIEGLKSQAPPGRPRVKGLAVEKELEKLLTKTPREFGYQEGGWTVSLLMDYFSRRRLSIGDDTVRRALKRRDWVYKRFAKAVPKNAPSKEEKGRRIGQLKENLRRERPDELLFVDEAHFMTGPYVQRGWCKKGEKKKFPVR